MRIAIAAHGRFHAFDLTRELLRRGHQVMLLTNYPKFAAGRFGLPAAHVRSLVLHGVLSRVAWRLRQRGLPFYPEAWLHTWFGRWVATQVRRERWDVAVCWSSIGEETFQALQGTQTLRVCQRGSAHICTQARLLQEEEVRTGSAQDRPSPWIVAREEREYALADVIQVPSTFAKQTFLTEGLPPEKVDVLTLGVNTATFRATPAVIEARCARILSGRPMRVLNVGTFSFQKGMWDIRAVIRSVDADRFAFRFVGPIAPECTNLVSELSSVAIFIPKQPQEKLPSYYAWGDVFILPTIQDGFQMVLAQAAAAGLPILTTSHGAGQDLVREAESGWVLPIRSSNAFVDRLRWCDEHRDELAAIVRCIYNDFQPRDWADVAADFETLCLERLGG